MRRVVVLMIGCITALPTGVLGVIILGVTDHFDSSVSAGVARMYPEVAEQAQALADFLHAVIPRTLSDVERLFGRPTAAEPDSTYAMPLCQNRLIALSGNYQGRSKVHAEFYPIERVGGVQVWYLHDSTTVVASVAYLRVDSLFMPYNRETQNQLGTRLSWDQDHLAALEQALRRVVGQPAPPDSALVPPPKRDEQR